jgi:isopentenyl-diphosphate delta-isomerase
LPDTHLQPGANQTSQQRKEEHLKISLNNDVDLKDVTTGLEEYDFLHQALPELDLAGIDLSSTLFGKKVKAPLIISSMVGGIDAVATINRNLAQAAQSLGLAMGVGSQRCMIEDPATVYTYAVRDVAPDILLFANLGAIQLNNGYGIRECLLAVESIEADALVLHLNPLQEALQPEGNTNFAGLLGKIETVCRKLPVPVIVKEVGWGISGEVARKLAEAGVAGIDIAGTGGTSWSQIEGIRSGNISKSKAFARWGIPTADSVNMAKQGAPDLTMIASGGIRTGLDVAKVIALGADAAGMAAPLLRPASISPEAVVAIFQEVIEFLKIAMFCIGTGNISQLKNTPRLVRRRGGKEDVLP